MRVAVVKCRDCGTVLNETKPFDKKDEGWIRLSSGLVAGPCPKGCRSTFRDMNLNTVLEFREASAAEEKTV